VQQNPIADLSGGQSQLLQEFDKERSPETVKKSRRWD
jgi:hypothetical protein